MYYDVLLTALPVFLLYLEPGRYLRPRLLALLPLPRGAQQPEVLSYFEPRAASSVPVPLPLLEAGPGRVWTVNGMVPLLTTLLLLSLYLPSLWQLTVDRVPPYDTYCLAALWLWCGWLWIKGPDAGGSANHR
jgi:hypothetical protein